MRDVIFIINAAHVHAAGENTVLSGVQGILTAAGADITVDIIEAALAHEQGAVKQCVRLLCFALRQAEISQVCGNCQSAAALIRAGGRRKIEASRILFKRGLSVGALVFVYADYDAVFAVGHRAVHIQKLLGGSDNNGVEGQKVNNDSAAGKLALQRFEHRRSVVCVQRRGQ